MPQPAPPPLKRNTFSPSASDQELKSNKLLLWRWRYIKEEATSSRAPREQEAAS